ncbi:putative amidase [Trichoderma ceciliae]
MSSHKLSIVSYCLQILHLFRPRAKASEPSYQSPDHINTNICPLKPPMFLSGEMPFSASNPDGAAGEIDVLRTTATDLKAMLDKGLITSRVIVQVYLRQIRRHNSQGMGLNALIDVAPEGVLLAFADMLDSERAAGNLRGDYHGIPIVLKDTINTDPSLGMRTTLGSYAMASARPARSALVVDVLLKHGLIILAKANLSEFGTNKCKGISPAGWSPIGGQTQSPYIKGGVVPCDTSLGHSTPGGSSSGSAVSVAAGFAPWSIGAETDGSLQTPASRASLYALKPTAGKISKDGIFRLTDAFDSLGGMAKTAQDLAALTEILFLTVPSSPLAGKDLTAEFRKSLHGLRLGFVDVNDWTISPTALKPDEKYLQQRRDHWNHAISEFSRLGAKIISPIKIKKPSEYTFRGNSSYQVIRYGGWKRIVAAYLNDLAETEVHSLEDIVEFSKKNPGLEFSDSCPNQNSLIDALKYNILASVVDEAVRDVRQAAGTDGVDRVLEEYGIDAIVAPTESEIHRIASFAGYPIGTMPLGYLLPSGRPHGLSILSSESNDALILGIMHVYETMSFTRKVPSYLNSVLVEKARI